MVETVFAESHSQFDGANIARMSKNVRDRQVAETMPIMDSRAIHHNRAHLTVNHFIWIREVLFQRRRDGDHLERRSWLGDTAHSSVPHPFRADAARLDRDEGWALSQIRNLACA